MSIKLVIAVFFLHLISNNGAAQKAQFDFNHITGANGISVGKITSITQDKFGYMWFADQTNKCITRFDGYRMKSFSNIPGDNNSPIVEGLEAIAADSSGNLWMGNVNGLDKFDPVTNKFTHYSAAKKNWYVLTILVDHLDIIWMGTNIGLSRFDEKTGKFTHYINNASDSTSLSCNIVYSLYEDHEGVLWVGTGWPFGKVLFNTPGGGLNKFNRHTGTFTRYMHNPKNQHSLINDKVRAIFEDSRGVFWVGTQGDGLHIMDRKKGTFERLTYDPSHSENLSRPPIKKGDDFDHIPFITEDGAGAIWIGTYSQGLVKYNPDTKEIIHFKADGLTPKGFYDSTSWCAFKSRDGALWIATESSNLFLVDPLQVKFSYVNLNEWVWSFFEDSSNILLAGFSQNGMARIDRRKPGKEQVVKYSIGLPDIRDPSHGIGINSISPAGDGVYWVATFKGVYLFNSNTGSFTKTPYTNKKTGKHIEAIGVLNDNKNGKLYIAGIGLHVVDIQTGSIIEYWRNPSDASGVSGDTLVTIKQDRSGNMWIGTFQRGLNFFDKKTQKFKHYLQGSTVFSIYIDKRETIWVGTDLGLYRKDKVQDNFSAFTSEELELRTASVTSLIGDDDNNIWGSSTIGIIRINTITNEVCVYGRKFGTSMIHLRQKTEAIRTADGKIFIGGVNGYYFFNPKEVVNYRPPQIILTGFKIDGQPVKRGKDSPFNGLIEETNEIKLDYKQNIFSIDFAAIHYSDAEKNIIQYQLEGYENTWRNVSLEKTAYYFNIPPDHYVFRIKAVSSYGIVSEKSIQIIILPPWWQTWWFRIIAAILIIAAIYSFIQYRSRNLKQRNILLEKKVTQRTNELNNSLAELKTTQDQLIQSEKMASLGELTSGIAHEIKNPLNFIRNFSELNMELITEIEEQQIPNTDEANQVEKNPIMETLKKNSEKINHHGKRIDEIVKGMLHHARLGNITKEPVNINALCDESLKLAYHGFRAKEKIFNASFETRFDPDLPKIMVTPQDFGRVLLNLINNAFYTVNEKKNKIRSVSSVDTVESESLYRPSVIVTTKRSGDKISITVSDNGMGIPSSIINKIFQPFFTTKPTGEGTGLGLSMSYDIITKNHGGELRAKSKEDIGTDFEIILPV